MASKKKNTTDFSSDRPPKSIGDAFYGLQLDEEQVTFANAIWNPDIDIVFVDAKAGTGKTTIAVGVANLLVHYGFFDELIYIMSPYGERKQGWLPGTITEKSSVYFEALYQALVECNVNINTAINTDSMVNQKNGAGWYYRHVHAIAEFVRNHTDMVNKRLHCLAERTKEWDAAWENKVKQYQVPLFSSNTNAEWLLSFDSAIADALELGALRCEAVTLTAEQTKRLEQFRPKDVPLKVLTTLAEFYIANKQEQSEWVILPVTNIGAYLGSSSLGRQYLSKIPPELMERKQSSFGASVYKMML